MFTGIISSCEPIYQIEENNGNRILTISKPTEWMLRVGESVNVNGVCSTVVESDASTFRVEYMPETLRLTTMRHVSVGAHMNLERSMTLNDLLSGHLVYGHVDAMGTIDRIVDDGESHIVTIVHDARDAHLLISKGSITINGISLTVVNPTETEFSVAIIPHTWEATNTHNWKKEDAVNLEYDMLAKYISNMMQHGAT